MSYLVVARKWRPQSFEEVAGQGHITRTLQNAIRTNRIAHAYLFTGVRGVGKTTAARILAKALNCENGPTATPCNQCGRCEEITSGKCIDVFEIDGASNRGIDEVRQIIENVRYQPANCRFKIYIIDEVHQVTKEAFNALLKTLEEPPPSVKFILATTDPQRLPETILSRCQRYDFRRIALREIVERLADIAKKEGLSITDRALMLLAREADGSMRDAQSLLEQVLASAGLASDVNEQSLRELLGLSEQTALFALSSAVIGGNAARCLQLIAAMTSQGSDICRLSRDLVEHFRNLMVARLTENSGGNPAELLDLPDEEIAELKDQAKDLAPETLMDYLDFMSAGDEEVARSANPRFALEATTVRLATLPKSLPINELVERLERLEQRLAGRPMGSGTTTKAAPMAGVPPVQGINKAPAAANRPPENDQEQIWRDFVSAVRKEKITLLSYLEHAKVLELSAGRLCISVSDPFHASILQDAENFAALKSIAKTFFSAETAIEVTLVAENAAARGQQGDGAARAVAGAERSQIVNDALRILGGTVRAVRRDSSER
jgi:DNA polymerase-3 subunit gamma/tau